MFYHLEKLNPEKSQVSVGLKVFFEKSHLPEYMSFALVAEVEMFLTAPLKNIKQ